MYNYNIITIIISIPYYMTKIRLTTEIFIERANLVHHNKYDYSNTNYILSNTKLHISCNVHGDFIQRPLDHLNGSGCPKCKGVKIKQIKSLTQSQFIERSTNIHDNKYNYDSTVYDNWNSVITIICPIHGEFKQQAGVHILGFGCQSCTKSKRIVTVQDRFGVDNTFQSTIVKEKIKQHW